MTKPVHSIKFNVDGSDDDQDIKSLGLTDPKFIVKELDKYIIGQDRAKKILALMMLNRSLVMLQSYGYIKTKVKFTKSNALLLGPTGTGKTAIIEALNKICDVPILIYDVTNLTAAGYAGTDMTEIFNNYVDMYMEFLSKSVLHITDRAPTQDDRSRLQDMIHAGRYAGIIYLDEIDKLRMNQDKGYGLSIQNELLKAIEGSEVSLRREHGYKSDEARNKLDLKTILTNNIFFIAGGAFYGLEEIIQRRTSKNSSIGFTGDISKKSDKDKYDIFTEATTEDIIEYGFRPEFLGRFPIRATLQAHTLDTMRKILLDSELSIAKEYTEFYKLFKLNLEFTDTGIDTIAKSALEMKTGARALKSMFNRLFEDTLFNIFDTESGETLIIDKEYVESKLKI